MSESFKEAFASTIASVTNNPLIKLLLPLKGFTIDILRNKHFILLSLFCLMVSHLFIWQRGLYLDDSSMKYIAINAVTGERMPIFNPAENPNYPARILFWMILPQIASLIPENEFVVRVLMSFMVGLNALLLGNLTYRIMKSLLVSVMTVWLFLLPIFTDVVFWLSAGAYIIVTLLILLALHFLWGSFVEHKNRTRNLIYATLLFGVSFLFAENSILLVALTPVLWLISRFQESIESLKVALRRLLLSLGCLVIAVSSIYTAIYTNTAVIKSRNGLDLNLLAISGRALQFVRSAMIWTIDDQFGWKIVSEVLKVGLAEFTGSWLGLLLLLLLIALCFLCLFSWNQKLEYVVVIKYYKTSLVLFVFGFTWFLFSLLFPYILAKSVFFERRYLYIPSAGLSLMASIAMWWLCALVRSVFAQRIALFLGLTILSLSTIITVGYCRIYAERSKLDAEQLAKLEAALPSDRIPLGAIIVSYQNDESVIAGDNLVEKITIGVFEAPWSAYIRTANLYKRNDIHVIVGNRWAPMNFQNDLRNTNSNTLFIQGDRVPIEKLIMFQFKEDNIYFIQRITIKQDDGALTIINLPISGKAAYGEQYTIPNIDVTFGEK